jgi:hypothetical protein
MALVWLCFLARGLFYCSFLPLWEGYDEWAHFAYIDRLVTSGGFLVDRYAPVSREVQASLKCAPVPWEMSGMQQPSVTQDDYWRLPLDQRMARQSEFRAIPQSWSRQTDPPSSQIYEALQPPLYYWLLSGPYRIVSGAPLADRVFFLRYVSLVIASFSVPLVFLAAYRVFDNAGVALGTAALLAVAPEFMVDVCRVGNECLGVLLYSWLALLSLDLGRRRTGIFAGIALGLGLLTKAYFLTAVPALGVLYTWRIWKAAKERRAPIYNAIVTFGIALLIGGWWYIRNYVATGTWSGLNESVMLRQYGLRQLLAGIGRVQWWRAIDSILVSHVWFGGWSSLGVRAWIYHVLFLVAGLAMVGVALVLRRSAPVRRSSLYPLLAFYGLFWVGQLYNVLLLFLSKGVSTSMGWYMYCVVAAESALLVAGLRAITPKPGRAWVLPALITCLAVLDLYTVHFVSIPHYTGLIAHRANGSLTAFHLSQLYQIGLHEVLDRLSMNKVLWLKPATLGVIWGCYLAATLSLAGLSFWLGRYPPRFSPHPE